MPTRPSEILDLACQIRAQATSEVSHRSAISRAYYAALLRTDEVIPGRPNQGGEPDKNSSHEQIIGRVDVYRRGANPGREHAAFIYKLLPKMRRERVKADYKLSTQVEAVDCDAVITNAQAVLGYCDQIHDRQQGQAQIQN